MLRGAGVGLALPLLNAMAPATARAQSAAAPRRMFAICNNLGLLPDEFFPANAGPRLHAVELPQAPSGLPQGLHRLLRRLAPQRGWRPPVRHQLPDGSPAPGQQFFPQHHLARPVHRRTHRQSDALSLAHPGRQHRGALALLDRQRRRHPAGTKRRRVFRQMFIQGSPKEVEAKIAELDTGRSILDAVADQVRGLERSVGAADRARLDQYFTSVRELENRLQESKGWERKPKPVVKEPEPQDPASPAQYMAKVANMYRLVRLAFETDSTRAVTLMLDSVSTPVVEIKGATISDGYHNLSHHGKSEAKLAQLRIIDSWHMRLLADLFKGLKGVQENGETLLDRAMVLYGSNLGDANAHSTTNMPVLLAGGGFRHAGHLAFDRNQNYPLPNLFVSMLQRMGIETGKFASSTGTMSGLEMTKA